MTRPGTRKLIFLHSSFSILDSSWCLHIKRLVKTLGGVYFAIGGVTLRKRPVSKTGGGRSTRPTASGVAQKVEHQLIKLVMRVRFPPPPCKQIKNYGGVPLGKRPVCYIGRGRSTRSATSGVAQQAEHQSDTLEMWVRFPPPHLTRIGTRLLNRHHGHKERNAGMGTVL